MIKVLVAEDEHLERKAIKFYLNKFYADEIILTAEVSNGQEAFFQALEKEVDLVLMDIKMPKLTGLEAAEKLKKENPELEIIILTAHSEFEYARKSIQIGVSDYLVKPYLEEDFKKVINKSLTKIKNKSREKLRQQRLINRLQKITPILEKEIILNVVYNTEFSLDKFLEHKQLLGIKSNKYMFLTLNSSNLEKIDQQFFAKYKQKLKQFIPGLISHNGLQNIIFLLIDSDLAKKVNSSKFEELVKEMKIEFKEKYHDDLNLIYSDIDDNYHNINEIYNQTRSQIEDDELSINSYPYQTEKKIFARLVDKNITGVLDEFKYIFDYLNKHNKLAGIKDFLKRFLVFLNRRLMEYYDQEKSFLKMKKLETEINLIDNPTGLKIYFENILKDLVEDLRDNESDEKVEVIETVKEYIKENYQEDISLEEVAEYISFSKYYLSKLFKEVEGINYKDYLIKIRMENAKKLLKNGSKIKVVAAKVGYSDRNYFSRAFKKYTGFSPGKFK